VSLSLTPGRGWACAAEPRVKAKAKAKARVNRNSEVEAPFQCGNAGSLSLAYCRSHAFNLPYLDGRPPIGSFLFSSPLGMRDQTSQGRTGTSLDARC